MWNWVWGLGIGNWEKGAKFRPVGQHPRWRSEGARVNINHGMPAALFELQLEFGFAIGFGFGFSFGISFGFGFGSGVSCDFACRYQSFAFICISHKKLRYHFAATVCLCPLFPLLHFTLTFVQSNPFSGISYRKSHWIKKQKLLLPLFLSQSLALASLILWVSRKKRQNQFKVLLHKFAPHFS